jgi:hypothetical protein
MIPRADLPEDASEWQSVRVDFERLSEDSPASCPRSEDNVFEYVQTESGDSAAADRFRLLFIRTAAVAEAKYWMWSYCEDDGRLIYVVFRSNPDGSGILGLSEPNGLSPEQYLLADYYDEVYWP